LIRTSASQAEPFQNGFEMQLLDEDGNVIGTDVTHDIDLNNDGIITPETESGWYQFDNLPNGNYSVQPVPASAWQQSSSRSSALALVAYELDQTHGFYFNKTFYQNSGGLGERWLRADDGWYYITPPGDLYKWNGQAYSPSTPLTGTLVVSLGYDYYRTPALLHAAENPAVAVTDGAPQAGFNLGLYQPAEVSGRVFDDVNPDGVRANLPENPVVIPYTGNVPSGTDAGTSWFLETTTNVVYGISPKSRVYQVTTGGTAIIVGSVSEKALVSQQAMIDAFFHDEPWLNGTTVELLDENGFVIASQVTGNRDLNHDGIHNVSTEAGWFVFAQLPPGSYSVRQSPAYGSLRTTALTSFETAALQQTLSSLGFQSPARDFFNFGGRNERWIMASNGGWHFVTPDGSLYRWDHNSGGAYGKARGTFIASVPRSWYLNLNLFNFTSTATPSSTVGQGQSASLLFGQHHVLDGLFSDLADDLLN
ncbi:MAG: hypothetical protein KDA85_22325, partial [Planctomycetaceae bacterium]|nr:hypothetical protein [Planctomycetaceae bacterium]